MNKMLFIGILVGLLAFLGCSRKNPNALPEGFQPRPALEFTIEDSSKIQYFTSGLGIYVVEEGPGEIPKPRNIIVMDYVGKLSDGKVFDSSYERPDPFVFSLGGADVIAGMAEGVSNLRYGSKAILIIPAELAYKDESRPNIPPNSTLIFHVDLLGSF